MAVRYWLRRLSFAPMTCAAAGFLAASPELGISPYAAAALMMLAVGIVLAGMLLRPAAASKHEEAQNREAALRIMSGDNPPGTLTASPSTGAEESPHRPKALSAILFYFCTICGVAVIWRLVTTGSISIASEQIPTLTFFGALFAIAIWFRWDVAPQRANQRKSRG